MSFPSLLCPLSENNQPAEQDAFCNNPFLGPFKSQKPHSHGPTRKVFHINNNLRQIFAKILVFFVHLITKTNSSQSTKEWTNIILLWVVNFGIKDIHSSSRTNCLGEDVSGGSGGGGIGAWGSFPPLTYPGLTNRLLWVLPGSFRVASHSETPK